MATTTVSGKLIVNGVLYKEPFSVMARLVQVDLEEYKTISGQVKNKQISRTSLVDYLNSRPVIKESQPVEGSDGRYSGLVINADGNDFIGFLVGIKGENYCTSDLIDHIGTDIPGLALHVEK